MMWTLATACRRSTPKMVNSISGLVFDWHGNEPYFTRIQLIRINDQVKVVPKHELDLKLVRALPEDDPELSGHLNDLELDLADNSENIGYFNRF